jgi:glycosyltransferase involved in cell wall biosynthesis
MSADEPLVSVMMPCFNAERTLPMALSSLRAQTYQNWEVVVVDDGSTDRTRDILNAFGDDRLRLERFETNRGRGAARHRCLEMARGDLLGFLDADDWLFPNKLKHQVALMHEHPEITVLGAACIITDAAGNAMGQTRTGLGPHQELAIHRLARLGPPPLGFPPCMVRMDAARHAHFNPAFRRSQDSDFLLKVMLGRTYGMSATPLYAYSQAEAASLDKTLEGYRYRLRCYGQYTERYPLRSRTQMAKTIARMGIYKTAGLFHAEQPLIARRWAKLSREAEDAFRDAKRTVTRAANDLRGVS